MITRLMWPSTACLWDCLPPFAGTDAMRGETCLLEESLCDA